jgi:predicted membrane metal-binding protein
MLILSTVLFLLTGCKDGITSLFMASTIIILVTPYASQDVGLWLSILATFGIIVAVEMLNENYRYEDVTIISMFQDTAHNVFRIRKILR